VSAGPLPSGRDAMNDLLTTQYLPIAIFIGVALFIGAALDVRYYLVSILFIIFDLEIAFLFPWAVAFKEVGLFGFWSMMAFLGVLTIGFIYEWKKGALEWE
jgi:NADH-quinone oxidoreductase subunit A